MKNLIVNFSGGKDSTDCLIQLLERGETIHSVIYFDTGWDFPQMEEHIQKVEEFTGIKILKLTHKETFNYILYERPC